MDSQNSDETTRPGDRDFYRDLLGAITSIDWKYRKQSSTVCTARRHVDINMACSVGIFLCAACQCHLNISHHPKLMQNSLSQYDDPALKILQTYLLQHPEVIGKAISHPDASVNKIADKDRDSLRKAAVLIPIIEPDFNRNAEVLLTIRSKNLRSHPGQISFPGGSRDEGDDSVIETALREAEEEIGIKSDSVEVLGVLGEIALPSGFCVTPVLGLVEAGLDYSLCPIEVADIFTTPLALLLDPQAYKHTTMTYKNLPRNILEIQYEKYRIWGATAAILHHLAVEVAAVPKSRIS